MALCNTHYSVEYISEVLSGRKKIFFAGIGGVSMCSLAQISHIRGHFVSGYDRTPSALTHQLENAGITVYYEADASHIIDCDALVYTVAMPPDNPEYAAAQKRGIPCISRANFLGYLMTGYTHRIGISGTHGKSTTTSMLEKIFAESGRDPTMNCGAVMLDTGTAHRIGSLDYFIFEACEYMDSFLDFYPTTAIILNIEMDHVDYFKSMDQIRSSFSAFISKSDIAVVNICDDDVALASSGYSGNLVTFGVDYPAADYYTANTVFECGCGSFDIYHRGEYLCSVTLCVPGAHSVCDALAAAAASHENGVSGEEIARGLSSYRGAGRRMEFCGMTDTGAAIYTDYAHHPTEIATTLSAAGDMGFKRVFCVFQPHTYSRTNELFDSFASALADSSCHEIILSPIYSAREINTFGVTSEQLAEKIRKTGKTCHSFSDCCDIADYLSHVLQNGDMAVIMGAGDITALIRLVL